ncbi:HdeD family acid-resistance protein [Actinoplanes derwentensis]|uniref:HdeD family acid-resistance protein n=1 Tax=Actinoplanes derwentensis TaxID=113562 RepID=UPI0012FD062B|nr:hypothetical protein [Actinoplanes derwentensis]
MTVQRGHMWGVLMFAGVAWLVIGWAVLRMEPADVPVAAGAVVLFGALCEVMRALAGTRTWWLNAGLAVVFAATGVALLVGGGSSFTAPASLVGWYLLVRGAVDVAVGVMSRGSDRVWSLLVTVGVLETGLGFFAAGPFVWSAELVAVVLGGLGVLRGVADLVTALRLRELAGPRRDVLELPPERAAGLAGYTAGMTDTEKAPWPKRADTSPTAEASRPSDAPRLADAARIADVPRLGSAPQAGEVSRLVEMSRSVEASRSAEAPWVVEAPRTADIPRLADASRLADAFRAADAGSGPRLQPADVENALRVRLAETASGPRLRPVDVEHALGTRPVDADGVPEERVARHRARPEVPEPEPMSMLGEAFRDRAVRTSADLDSMLAQAGITGPRAGSAHRAVPDWPVTVEGEAERR